MRAAICAGAVLLTAFAATGTRGAEGNRIGFEESFDSTRGWKVGWGAPLKSMAAKDGRVRFETVRGALNHRMKRADWPEWPAKPHKSTTGVTKEYRGRIDFDKYRYIVVKLDERGTKVKLSVAGRWVPVCYTTGLRAMDLRNAGLTGKRDMKLSIELLNSSGVGTFDFIRLVSVLTPEERKVLMGDPVEYRTEGTVSGARVWKLTAQPGDQSLGGAWSDDGRFFSIGGGRDGRRVYDFAEAKWRETRLAGGAEKAMPVYHGSWPSRDHPGVTYGYRTSWHRPKCDFVLYRFDAATGKETEFARFTTDGKWDTRELARASKGDVAAVGLRGTPDVWIIDPEAKDAAARVKYVKLDARLKGLGFIKDDTHLVWFNCYTYEQRQMDLATGKVSLGYYTSGGHAGSGGGRTLRHYAGMTVVQPSGLTDWKAGDLVKVFAYYKTPIGTDYGRLVDGGRWWLVNGTSRDVRNQHIMVDGEDCATILRLCGYNTSRNNWATNTYPRSSPDATKVAWVSDQLGDGDVYYVTTRRPDPVRGLKARPTRAGAALSWSPPARSQEVAGYIVYGARRSERRYRALARVSGTEWSGPELGPETRFIVAAREHSGLEGYCSQPVTVGDERVETLHFEAELAERSRTARLVVDGRASGHRAVRAHVASKAEEKVKAKLTFALAKPPRGELRLFGRSREDAPGAEWKWSSSERVKPAGGKFDVIVAKDRLLDKVVLTSDPKYVPKTADDRFAAPARLDSGLAYAKDGRVKVRWPKPAEKNLSHVEIFAGTGDDFACDNTTAIGAVPAAAKREFYDWGMKPGTTVTYKLVAVDTRGKRSAPAAFPVNLRKAKLVSIGFTAEKIDTANPEHVKRSGEEMLAPKPVAAKRKPEPGDYVPLSLDFEAPVAGRYAIWVRYAPGYTSRLKVPVKLDGKDVGAWYIRAPYRPMSGTLARPEAGKAKVFTDRLRAQPGAFELKAGKHTLTLMLDPTIEKGNVHAIGKVWITNDPSWRAPGFNPRADFGK